MKEIIEDCMFILGSFLFLICSLIFVNAIVNYIVNYIVEKQDHQTYCQNFLNLIEYKHMENEYLSYYDGTKIMTTAIVESDNHDKYIIDYLKECK